MVPEAFAKLGRDHKIDMISCSPISDGAAIYGDSFDGVKSSQHSMV
jgi:hypothetical protein